MQLAHDLTAHDGEQNQVEPENSDTTNSAPALLAWMTVVVAALGYFVDVIDLWLFSNFRVASLRDLGLTPSQITITGAFLINCQQAGLLLGGLLWGILGDKRGRSSVMFGSIILYSVANILNAFVTDVSQYAILRFVTGIGLAGEIGAGVTLVCEILPKHQRGVGTTIVTGLGVAGAVVAALMGKYLEWRIAFLVGGMMGLALLGLRFLTHDSSMFAKMEQAEGIRRGSLRLLLLSRHNCLRFLSCIALGIPIYLSMGVFATFSPEIAAAFGFSGTIDISSVLLATSVGMTVGDLFAGVLSQKLQRRKLPLGILLISLCVVQGAIASGYATNETSFVFLCGLAGLFGGYWACHLTTSAEQFGTNIRATATTMIPNLIRATAIPLTAGFVGLKHSMPMHETLWILVAGSSVCAFLGLFYLKETFHRDLDFYEE